MTNRFLFLTSMAAALLALGPAASAQTSAGGRPAQAPKPVVVAPSGQKVVVSPAVAQRQGPQAFSVVLVVGEMQNTTTPDSVPAAARKALTDMKDFLPYRSYRLLDTQWTLCCGKGPVFGRLRGVDDQEYELQLTPSISYTPGGQAPVVNVRFMLAESSPGAAQASAAEALASQIRTLQASSASARTADEQSARAAEERVRSLERELAQVTRRTGHSRTVMDASFRMDVGETVVVGTSRIHGDKALIALLTAVPPKGAAGR